MTGRTCRLLIHLSLLFPLMFVTGKVWAAGMETVRIAPDNKGFILHPSGDRYVPWGHNYASVDIIDRLANDPARVEREFLLKSRDFAHGWLGHWPDESPAKLAELKRTGKATIHNAIWLSWVDLFQEIGPQMTGRTSR